MKIIPTHLFAVVEAPESQHLALKKLLEFLKNVKPNLHVFINFPSTSVIYINFFVLFVCVQLLGSCSYVVVGVPVQFFMDLIITDCPMGMHVHGRMDGIQMPPWNAFDKRY